MRNGFDCGWDLEAPKIGATKHISRVRWSGDETNVNRDSSV
jgi:hypothetical protein